VERAHLNEVLTGVMGDEKKNSTVVRDLGRRGMV
jgi:hypothetical protein